MGTKGVLYEIFCYYQMKRVPTVKKGSSPTEDKIALSMASDYPEILTVVLHYIVKETV